MKTVEIYTDGACSGNPGPGGWGVVLRCGSAEKELSGNQHGKIHRPADEGRQYAENQV